MASIDKYTKPTIQTDIAYREALQCVEEAFDRDDLSMELVDLVVEYEEYHFPIG